MKIADEWLLRGALGVFEALANNASGDPSVAGLNVGNNHTNPVVVWRLSFRKTSCGEDWIVEWSKLLCAWGDIVREEEGRGIVRYLYL